MIRTVTRSGRAAARVSSMVSAAEKTDRRGRVPRSSRTSGRAGGGGLTERTRRTQSSSQDGVWTHGAPTYLGQRPAHTSPHPPPSSPGGGEAGRPPPGSPRCHLSRSHPCGVCVGSWAFRDRCPPAREHSAGHRAGCGLGRLAGRPLFTRQRTRHQLSSCPTYRAAEGTLGSTVPSWPSPRTSDHGHERIVLNTEPPPKGECDGTPRACA